MFFIMAILSLLLPSRAAAAANVYFAQSAVGAANGADCADAFAYNDGTNGISKLKNWVPGNTLHICGTISGGSGQNLVAAQASGTSGNPITIKFEPGAILQDPYCGTGGSACINISGHSFITIDGGNTGKATTAGKWTGGLVQSYANGTAGANNCPGVDNSYTGACTSQVLNVTMIEAIGSSNIIIENLGPCVGSVGAFGNGAPGNACIHFQGSNVTITNNQFAYDGIGIDNTSYGNASNTDISDNDFQQQGWGIGCAGAAVTNTNYQVHDNHFHNFTQWNSSGAHVNGIHCYDNSGGGIDSFYLYNNLFDGPMGGSGWTAWAYFEANGPGQNWVTATGTLYAFNNVFVATGTVVNGNGMLNFGAGAGHMIVNNFFYGSGTSGASGTGPCMDFQGQNITVQNNVFMNCTQIMAGPFGGNPGPTWSSSSFDYNIYSNMTGGGNNAWQVNSIAANTLADWQNACGCDAHARAQLGSLLSNITNEGVPSAGFMGLESGANLSTNATGLMAALGSGTSAGNTVAPAPRPGGSCSTQGSSSCWSVGAYSQSSGSGGTPPPAPANLTASVE